MRHKLISFICRLVSRIFNIIYSYTASTSRVNGLVHSPEDFRIASEVLPKFVRIDVGLSNDASNSAEWLLDTEDRLVLGVEPHPGNIAGLIDGVPKFHSVSLREGVVRRGLNLKYINDLKRRFLVIRGAAGSCAKPTPRKFYSAYPDKGNSSLYRIHSVESTGNITDQEFEVTEFPLSMIFDELWRVGYEFVETLKIDTEGHELEVLKGAGGHLDKVLFCRVECFKGLYPNTKYANRDQHPETVIFQDDGYVDSASVIMDYLERHNFSLIGSRPGDYLFLNEGLRGLLAKNELYP